MQTKNASNATSGIANGHWEPTPRRSNLLALAREGISRLLGTHQPEQPRNEAPEHPEQRHTHH